MSTFYPLPECIRESDKYLVFRINGMLDEVVTQSDFSSERAQYSVEVLNDHETRNGRSPTYAWRLKHPGENNDIHRYRSEGNSRQDADRHAISRNLYGAGESHFTLWRSKRG